MDPKIIGNLTTIIKILIIVGSKIFIANGALPRLRLGIFLVSICFTFNNIIHFTCFVNHVP